MIFSKSSKRHSFSWFHQSDFPQTIHNQQVVQGVLKSQLQGGVSVTNTICIFFFALWSHWKKTFFFFFPVGFVGWKPSMQWRVFSVGFSLLKLIILGVFQDISGWSSWKKHHTLQHLWKWRFPQKRENISHPKGGRTTENHRLKSAGDGDIYIYIHIYIYIYISSLEGIVFWFHSFTTMLLLIVLPSLILLRHFLTAGTGLLHSNSKIEKLVLLLWVQQVFWIDTAVPTATFHSKKSWSWVGPNGIRSVQW